MEDSHCVIPNEPTQPPNELLHQTGNHISILYPGPFACRHRSPPKSTPYVIPIQPASILAGLSQTWVFHSFSRWLLRGGYRSDGPAAEKSRSVVGESHYVPAPLVDYGFLS